jgi:uncharacterized membrane protein YfcA
MKSYVTPLTVILAVLGLEDLIMVPVMLAAHSQPPMPAIILSAVIGIVTLAAIPALIRGRRWAFWTILVCRVLDAVSAALGAAGGPEPVFKVVGTIALVLSIAAIVMLVRFNRRRGVGATSPAEKATIHA